MEFFADAQKMKQTAAMSWLWKESESELVGGKKDQLLEKLHISLEIDSENIFSFFSFFNFRHDQSL